jgi:hypothetical protein
VVNYHPNDFLQSSCERGQLELHLKQIEEGEEKEVYEEIIIPTSALTKSGKKLRFYIDKKIVVWRSKT